MKFIRDSTDDEPSENGIFGCSLSSPRENSGSVALIILFITG